MNEQAEASFEAFDAAYQAAMDGAEDFNAGDPHSTITVFYTDDSVTARAIRGDHRSLDVTVEIGA